MEISIKEDGMQGVFLIKDNGKQIGLMNYTLSSGTMTIDHTEVDEDHEGEGLGTQLVKAGVTYARENHLKINPVCAFAKKVFEITPDFKEVLA